MREHQLSEFIHLVDFNSLPFIHEFEIIFGVHYLHVRIPEHGDIYLTRFGVTGQSVFLPPRFLLDKSWFAENAIRLEGTSATYKVPISPAMGAQRFVVIKHNRMGRHIPCDDESDEFAGAAFNSPFEEFSLVMELRDAMTQRAKMVVTQRPLAIYVPDGHVELWRTGREEYLMNGKISKHAEEISLDMHRDYVTIYEWIRGIDAAEAAGSGLISEETMVELTLDAEHRLQAIGYQVRDRKPHHVIVRPKKNRVLARTKQDGILYAVIDYELLERRPDYQQRRISQARLLYHRKQRDRFAIEPANDPNSQFNQTNILGVDYVYVHAESTGGKLWVVGRDPELVDYFYPERWENTNKTRLSASREIYHTVTEDAIHLVWQVSKAGMLPDLDPFRKEERHLLQWGYNTPFEEVSLALELHRRGIRVVYPRAIYEAAGEMHLPESLTDPRRYYRYLDCLSPDGGPAFKLGKTYIILWGFYNGSDQQLAEHDGEFLESVNVLQAYRSESISEKEYLAIMRRKKRRLRKVGVEDLNLHGHHLLISMTSAGKVLRSGDGYPDVRICNFEFLRRLS
jgi:hypothetical protein